MFHVQTSEAHPGKQNFRSLQATQIRKSQETYTYKKMHSK